MYWNLPPETTQHVVNERARRTEGILGSAALGNSDSVLGQSLLITLAGGVVTAGIVGAVIYDQLRSSSTDHSLSTQEVGGSLDAA
jgi:hypothetical protein